MVVPKKEEIIDDETPRETDSGDNGEYIPKEESKEEPVQPDAKVEEPDQVENGQETGANVFHPPPEGLDENEDVNHAAGMEHVGNDAGIVAPAAPPVPVAPAQLQPILHQPVQPELPPNLRTQLETRIQYLPALQAELHQNGRPHPVSQRPQATGGRSYEIGRLVALFRCTQCRNAVRNPNLGCRSHPDSQLETVIYELSQPHREERKENNCERPSCGINPGHPYLTSVASCCTLAHLVLEPDIVLEPDNALPLANPGNNNFEYLPTLEAALLNLGTTAFLRDGLGLLVALWRCKLCRKAPINSDVKCQKHPKEEIESYVVELTVHNVATRWKPKHCNRPGCSLLVDQTYAGLGSFCALGHLVLQNPAASIVEEIDHNLLHQPFKQLKIDDTKDECYRCHLVEDAADCEDEAENGREETEENTEKQRNDPDAKP